MQCDGRWSSRNLAAAMMMASALVPSMAYAQDQSQQTPPVAVEQAPAQAIAPVATPPAASETATRPSEPASAAADETPKAAAAPVSSPGTAEPALVTGATPLQIDVASALSRFGSKSTVDKRDRDALAAFYVSRDRRPLWVGANAPTARAAKLAAELNKASDWGLKGADLDVPALDAPSAGTSTSTAEQLSEIEIRLSLAALRYARFARGGRVEPTQITKYIDRKSQILAPATVLAALADSAEPDDYLQSLHPRHEQFKRLRTAWLDLGEARNGADGQRLLANMEQWRWMPDDLGIFHVTVNIPEMQLNVMRNGQPIHTERVIIGKLNTQTPVFSDEMEQVIFHPFWGVPDSIKQNEVLPSLRKNGSVLAKYNLRIQSGGRDIDPRAVDWSRTDIRKLHVYQPPGASNVLGVVKFRFPNKHDVYMHDTPTKSLFKTAMRTYSHGCMRVQNPVRLAELILAEDRRMSSDAVQSLTRKGSPENNQLNLSRRVPVHMTYFTAIVDDTGKVTTFKDIYGHEERVRLALDGKMNLIKPVPEIQGPARAEPVGNLVEIKSPPSISSGSSNWARNAYSGSDAFGVNAGN